MQSVISLSNVEKEFVFWRERPDSFKEMLHKMLSGKIRSKTEKIKVLKDVSFDIREGEFVGIMGRNGAGKSTILKIITGIYEPTSGSIQVNGRIAPLLELGAGFNPELSGYENIFLNAAILKFGQRATKERLKKIIDFSGLGDKIFMPVKNYSSGMRLRLGFSIASHIDADILILDEIIGVGDAGFKQKCTEKILELSRSGKTVLLVSHSVDAIQKYCERVIILQDGLKTYDGPVNDGTKIYLDEFGLAKTNESDLS